MKKLILILTFVVSINSLFSQDFDQAKNEIVYLNSLNTSIDQILQSINATNFGPFKISGKCGYDSHWYCFGDCKEWTWWWTFPNFTWLKTSLENRYQNVSQTAQTFPQSFSPVKNWLINTLPTFTQFYKQQMDVINTAKGQPNEKEVILSAIQAINNRLQADSDQIRSAIHGISNFNRNMTLALNDIEDLRQQMESSIEANNNDVKTQTESYPCDRDNARNQARTITDQVRNQFNSVTNRAQQFGVVASKVDASTSALLGVLVNVQGNYQGVMTNLENAQISPEGAVQQLRLNVTYQSWLSLADFANKELR